MIIQSKRVWIASQFVKAQVEMEEGKIKAIYPYDTKEVDVDYGTKRIVPGFYDIHTHGYDGWDTNDATEEGLRHWLKEITKEGVCGICPTTITQSHEVLSNALKNVARVYKENCDGAEILGVHFEGPYLDMKYKGAQPEQYIVQGTVEEFKEYQCDAEGLIKIITLAPEHDDNYELTKYCAANGVNVSVGHSNATYDETLLAIANGTRSFTHVYNGMTPFNHRNNGVVGAAYRFKDTFGEIICDGNHSTYAALNNYFTVKPYNCIMISDSLMCKGKAVGSKFVFGGQEIEIYPDGSAHLTSGSKSLAGSTLKINEGLKILVEYCQVPFDIALASCTCNPMRYLKMDDHKGYIKAGYDADIVILNDDYSVEQTYCKSVSYL